MNQASCPGQDWIEEAELRNEKIPLVNKMRDQHRQPTKIQIPRTNSLDKKHGPFAHLGKKNHQNISPSECLQIELTPKIDWPVAAKS